MNKLIVFTAPSGSGKTTIVRHLLLKYDQLAFSISATTRSKRAREQNGKDYYFMTKEEFETKIDQSAFLEWEEVYPNIYYGTLKSEVERLWKAGKYVIFDIDVQGATRLKQQYSDQCFVVFVKPPSFDVLIKRLKRRNTENKTSLEMRINKIREEMEYADLFDYCLLNDELSIALKEAENLIANLIN